MDVEDCLDEVLEARAGLAEVLFKGREHGEVERPSTMGGVGWENSDIDRRLFEEHRRRIAHPGGVAIQDEQRVLVRAGPAALDERNEHNVVH